MTVLTPVSREEADRLATRCGLGQVRQLSGIRQGIVNTNYYLFTDQADCVLTLVEEDAESLPFLMGLLDFLAPTALPVPRLVPDLAGQRLHRVAGRPALLTTLLPGTSPDSPTPNQCRQAGRFLGRLHQEGQTFPLARTNPLGPEQWRRILEEITPRLPGETALFLAQELDLARAWRPDLPRGVCHADFFPDNTLFVGEELAGVVDFYFACTDFLVYDLAIALNAWCFDAQGAQNPALLAAFQGGYRETRPLATAEEEALPTALGAAALRFALTRLRARLFPRPQVDLSRKDPEEYLARLRLFRAAAAR